jgi:hypothetical protein
MDVTKHFDSVSALLSVARGGRWDTDNRSDIDWAGGYVLDNVRRIQHGASEDDMRPARELLEQIDASFRDRETHAWMPSVAGAYPIVAELLQGVPDYMRAQRPIESDIAPVKLVIETAISAGVSHAQQARRGAAISALVMRLSEERPVELWAFNGMKNDNTKNNVVISAKLGVAPLNLSECVAVLASVGMARSVMFNVMTVLDGRNNGGIGWAFGRPNEDTRARALRSAMQLEPRDVLMQGGYLPDAALMNSDPVAWVHAQLEKQRTLDV